MSGPFGLKNYGNTCFLNAVLQSLAYCDHFWNAVNRSEACAKVDCLLCNLETFVLALRHPNSDDLLIDQYLSRLVRSFPVFPLKTLQRGRQEDAHEFLINIILAFGGEQSRSSLKSHGSVAGLFDGSIGSYIFCYECGNSSKKVEQMFGLELHINQQNNLESAIQEYCRIEDLAGSNSYACSHCQRNTRAQKCLRLEKLPKILIVQLKRFSYERNESHKINHYLRYPLDLDLKPFIMLDAKDAEAYDTDQYYPCYRLASFIVHLGETVDSGHYITFLRSRHSPNQWYKMDDLRVQEVSFDNVMSQLPYILCYEQMERDYSSPLLHVRWDNNTHHSNQNDTEIQSSTTINSGCSLYQSPVKRGLTFSSLLRGKSGFGFGSSPDYCQQPPPQEVPVIDLSTIANDYSSSNGQKHIATIQSSPSTYLQQPLHAYDNHEEENHPGTGLYQEVLTLGLEDQQNSFLYTLLESLLSSLVKGLITLTWWQLRGLRESILILLRKARKILAAALSSAINSMSRSDSQQQANNNGQQQQQQQKTQVEAVTEQISLFNLISSFIDGLLVTAFQPRSAAVKTASRKRDSDNEAQQGNNGHASKKRRGKPIWE